MAWSAFALGEAVALFAAAHAAMTKRDPKSAAGWCALILLSPVAGPLLYWLFGINRIEKKARKIYNVQASPQNNMESTLSPEELGGELCELSRLSSKMSPFPLRRGNDLRILENGEQAYPSMLKAIREAKRHVLFSTYIFDKDEAGMEFANELKAAAKRGVRVYVLIDDIGARYSFPSIISKLKAQNLKAKRFHRTLFPWLYKYSQLRSHRKVLLADGQSGFIGGMNVRLGHLITRASPKKRTQDLHFEVKGPVLSDLCHVFKQDWQFAAKERLDEVIDWKVQVNIGETIARAIPNDPQEGLGQHRWTILGAISLARNTIKIITPYFLPDQELLAALGTAAMRGVKIEILLPEKNNHFFAHWACMANLWQVQETGCEVYLSRPPFDHSKLMVVDGQWSFIGSSNWDARSFRLNFELNLECYGESFARELSKLFLNKKACSRPLSMEELSKRPFPVKLRDSLARLFIPYL